MPCWKADGVRLQRAACGSAGRVSGWIFPSGTRAPSVRKAAGTEQGLRAGGGRRAQPRSPRQRPARCSRRGPGGSHSPARPGTARRAAPGGVGPGEPRPRGRGPAPRRGGRREAPAAVRGSWGEIERALTWPVSSETPARSPGSAASPASERIC